MARCPRCALEFFSRIELPVEPLFRLDVAAELIPFVSAESLRRYLNRRHPEWKRFYRVIQGNGRRTLTLGGHLKTGHTWTGQIRP